MATREPKESRLTYGWNIVVGAILTGGAVVGHVFTDQMADQLPGYAQDLVLTALVLGIAFVIIYVVGFGLSTLTIREVLTRHQHEVASFRPVDHDDRLVDDGHDPMNSAIETSIIVNAAI